MRQIVLDTETTGLEHKRGHRIVEIGAVEICNRQLTGNHFHYYLNPERESDEGALQVHGLTTEFLRDKPKFADVSGEFLEFISDAELIIHNAPFDVGFINHELSLLDLAALDQYCQSVTDTLRLAKDLHPGKRNNLDALCERYAIDNSKRSLHGALLDAELLAEVYLAMTRGQESLLMELDHDEPGLQFQTLVTADDLKIIVATEEEKQSHQQLIDKIQNDCSQGCLWHKLESQN